LTKTTVKKVLKLELHLPDHDRERLLRVLEANRELAKIVYNVIRYIGKYEIVGERRPPSKPPARVRRMVKELTRMKGLDLSSTTIEL